MTQKERPSPIMPPLQPDTPMSSSETRNPVLLVHGINDTAAKFKTMTAYLTDQGWSVHSLNLTPNNGLAPLEVL
ncbi:MAG: esterase/lipase family protein, partial [Microcystaceae cyanobacterium]